MKYFAAVALLVGYARAECPNACSGHGRCTNYAAQFSSLPTQTIELQSSLISTFGYSIAVEKKDSCTCFSHLGHNGELVYQWTGPDCSIPTCPHAPAFAGDTLSNGQFNGGSSGSTIYHTQEIECSGQGYCDKGACICYPGYEGAACQRTQCPNSCSNAGRCMTLMQIAEDVYDANNYYYGDYMNTIAKYSEAFDREQSMGCVCDEGRSGPDCSLVDCPSGVDPMGGPGNAQGRACSGRGTCDTSTGICGCYDGFFGTKCEKQRNKMF